MGYNNKTYAIIDVANDLQNVDFSQVHETSSSTIRKSLDGTLTFIKWRGTEPTFITNGTIVPSQTLDHENVLALLSTEDWSEPFIEE